MDAGAEITATIERTIKFDWSTRTERVRWTLIVSDGRRKVVDIRIAALDWASEMGIAVRGYSS